MQARYYDPVIGRFYSNDPKDSVSYLSESNIHGFNRYAYALNNPYKYVDPDGRDPSSPYSMMQNQRQIRDIAKTDPAFHEKATGFQKEAVALLPGGQVVDIIGIASDISNGSIPLADSSSLLASEGTGKTLEAMDKDMSKAPGSKKVQVAIAAVSYVAGLVTENLVKPTEEIVENKGIKPQKEEERNQ